jgi:bifunctional DNA-binding transcriptional regulator/antitoxin component of YhaV-PrlF toxin-antitoxin module
MDYTVGTKGQVVIDKAIREALGVDVGYVAVQRLVDDHVEIHFYPPEHTRSLLGILAPYTNVVIEPEDWPAAVEAAWAAAAREKMGEPHAEQ